MKDELIALLVATVIIILAGVVMVGGALIEEQAMSMRLANQPPPPTWTPLPTVKPFYTATTGCVPRPTPIPPPAITPRLTPPTPAPPPTPGPPPLISTFVVPTLVHPLTEEEALKRAFEIDMNMTEWDDSWCIETLHTQPWRITVKWYPNESAYDGSGRPAEFGGTDPVWVVTIYGNIRQVYFPGWARGGQRRGGGIAYIIGQKDGWLFGIRTFMGDQQAINNAIAYASTPRPELSGAKIPPQNIQAQQMTLAAAIKLLTGSGNVPTGDDPNMIVWIVSMEGVWTDEAPRPTGFPTLEPYRHFTVIINPRTGEVIQSSAHP